jgi:flagellar M-ring protein FliF
MSGRSKASWPAPSRRWPASRAPASISCCPNAPLFSREQKDPTASIVLSVRGELSAGEIRAIQHLAASAIEGLTPARVSVVDDTGRLLASGAGNGPEDVIAGETEERTLNVENRLRARVEDLLANIVGSGRAGCRSRPSST